jgi:acetoin utilization deacetylase AcuC-like enzyme
MTRKAREVYIDGEVVLDLDSEKVASEAVIESRPEEAAVKKRSSESKSHQGGGKKKSQKVMLDHDICWNQMLDLKHDKVFTLNLAHVKSLKHHVSRSRDEVVRRVRKVLCARFSEAPQDSRATIDFIQFIFDEGMIDALGDDNRSKLYSICWNLLNDICVTEGRPVGSPVLLPALSYYLCGSEAEPQQVAILSAQLMALDGDQLSADLREALYELWFTVLLPEFCRLQGEEKTAEYEASISAAQRIATADCLWCYADCERLLSSVMALSSPHEDIKLIQGGYGEVSFGDISVVSPIPEAYLQNAVAAGCNQQARLAVIKAAAQATGALDPVAELPGHWLELMRMIADARYCLATVMGYYRAIPVADPLKAAMLMVHEVDYLEYMVAASVGARHYPVALGDPDVVIDCRGFEILARQYRMVLSMAQSPKPPKFSFNIGPPGHHCGRESPAGFCFSNTAALTALLSRPEEICVVLGLDINSDNGLHDIFLNHDGDPRPVIHHDCYDAEVYPEQTMVAKAQDQYQYCPFNAVGQDAAGMLGYLQARLSEISAILVEKKSVHCVVSLGWDSHIQDTTFGDKASRFTDEHMQYFYNGLKRLLVSYPACRISVVTEGGYELGVLSAQVAAMLRTIRPSVVAAKLPAGLFSSAKEDSSGGESSPGSPAVAAGY